jgi:uncharacterized protein (UPF0332 family)
MSLARAHLEKAIERLRAAEKLFQDGYYEDAVSRAYYAMYTLPEPYGRVLKLNS